MLKILWRQNNSFWGRHNFVGSRCQRPLTTKQRQVTSHLEPWRHIAASNEIVTTLVRQWLANFVRRVTGDDCWWRVVCEYLRHCNGGLRWITILKRWSTILNFFVRFFTFFDVSSISIDCRCNFEVHLKRKCPPVLYQSCFIIMEDGARVRLQYALAMAFVDHHVRTHTGFDVGRWVTSSSPQPTVSRRSLPPANPLPAVWPCSLLPGSVETSSLAAQTTSDFGR